MSMSLSQLPLASRDPLIAQRLQEVRARIYTARAPHRAQSRTSTVPVRSSALPLPVSAPCLPAAVTGVDRKSRKPGRLFFVTLNLECEVYEDIRKDFVAVFQDLITYVCAIEKSDNSELVSNHLHCFLEFGSEIFVDDLRKFVVDNFEEVCNKIDVQPCRSRRNCIKYCSKEDEGVYYNCKTSELHIYFRTIKWAATREEFRYKDPFVFEQRNQYRYIEKVYQDVRSCINAAKFKGFEMCRMGFSGWAMQCALAWNQMLRDAAQKKSKGQKLYLWGNTNVGKSTLIESFFGGSIDLPEVYCPGVGKFFMGEFDPLVHKAIVFEEFEYKYYPIALLKRLVEGRRGTYMVKCCPTKSFAFHGPIIFVSNYEEITDVAFRSRLTIVNATTPYWMEDKVEIPSTEEGSCSQNETENSPNELQTQGSQC